MHILKPPSISKKERRLIKKIKDFIRWMEQGDTEAESLILIIVMFFIMTILGAILEVIFILIQ